MMLGINDKIPRGKVLQWYRALMIDVFQTNLISFLRWFFLSFLKFFISNSFLNKTTPLITSVWKSEAFNLNIKERKRERERERERELCSTIIQNPKDSRITRIYLYRCFRTSRPPFRPSRPRQFPFALPSRRLFERLLYSVFLFSSLSTFPVLFKYNFVVY